MVVARSHKKSNIFRVEDNSNEIGRNRLQTFLACLEHGTISNKVIVDNVRIAKSKDMLASLGVTNLANELLPSHIVNDPRFCTLMVKIEREEQADDLKEYVDGLHPREKLKWPRLVL